MSHSKMYNQNELNQEAPKQMIASFKKAKRITDDDIVLAAFGRVGAIGLCNAVVSTKGAINYVNNYTTAKKVPVWTIYYSIIDRLELRSEGQNEYIYVFLSKDEEAKAGLKPGDGLKLDIKSSPEETRKMFNFLYNYKAIGTIESENKLKILKENGQKVNDNRRKRIQNDILELSAYTMGDHLPAYNFNYCGGFQQYIMDGLTHILVESYKELIILSFPDKSVLNIPFHDILDSHVKTETSEFPIDVKQEYTFYIVIDCLVEGKNCTVTFSRHQKLFCLHSIMDLDYVLHHLPERIQKYSRKAEYEQKNEKLIAEREAILKERASQIEQLHEAFRSNPDTNVNAQPENTQSSVTTASFSLPLNPFDEVKKFKELLDQGIITQEEFDAKKKQLLNL